MMNDVRQFAFAQGNFRQPKLGPIRVFVDINRAAKDLGSARRITILQQAFTDPLQQSGVTWSP